MPQVATQQDAVGALDVSAWRADFPLLAAAGDALHYLDNAATTQKPLQVIEAIGDCYRKYYGPVHRGLYPLAEQASRRYEAARQTVAGWIGAPAEQLVFTRSATESINMVAWGWARRRLRPGDQVWVSRMEHHANFLPWQAVCRETGAQLRIIELRDDGTLDLEACADLYGPRSRLIAISHVSNVLGVVNPVQQICVQAAERDIAVLIDAAQSVAHLPPDVRALRCDFIAFSAHKMFGPTGIGALYGSAARLAEMEPLLLGGGMVDHVGEQDSSWASSPIRFEAGSPNLADAIGFAAAVEYLRHMDPLRVRQHIDGLTAYALDCLQQVEGITLYGPGPGPGPGPGRGPIIAFNVADVHPHDLAQLAGERGVAIRAGHHCCQPLMRRLQMAATARASLAIYNTRDDVDALVAAVHAARVMFG